MKHGGVPYRAARLITAHVEWLAPLRKFIPPTDQEPWAKAEDGCFVPQGIDAARTSRRPTDRRRKPHVFTVSCANGGSPPRWNCDPKTGAEAPLTPGKLLDYRRPPPRRRHQIPWEVNRHLQLVDSWHRLRH